MPSARRLYRITFSCLASALPHHHRLRRLLKNMLRYHAFRCELIEELRAPPKLPQADGAGGCDK